MGVWVKANFVREVCQGENPPVEIAGSNVGECVGGAFA